MVTVTVLLLGRAFRHHPSLLHPLPHGPLSRGSPQFLPLCSASWSRCCQKLPGGDARAGPMRSGTGAVLGKLETLALRGQKERGLSSDTLGHAHTQDRGTGGAAVLRERGLQWRQGAQIGFPSPAGYFMSPTQVNYIHHHLTLGSFGEKG